MKVRIDSVDGRIWYDVRFQYKTGKKTGRKNIDTKKNIATYCFISMINENAKGSEKCQLVSTGKTVRSQTDQFDKYVGRKLALKRALEEIDRDTRRIFWNTYFEEIPN